MYQPQTISTSELTNNGYLVYGANGIIGHYHSYNHEQAQICITCRGNTCGQVTYTQPYSWITGNAMVVNVDNCAGIDKMFLFQYLCQYNFTPIISGSGQPQIVRRPLEKIKVPFPVIEEQTKIANTLSTIEDKIKLEMRLLRNLQLQKSFLLSKMFI